jgi:hypothetical protein
LLSRKASDLEDAKARASSRPLGKGGKGKKGGKKAKPDPADMSVSEDDDDEPMDDDDDDDAAETMKGGKAPRKRASAAKGKKGAAAVLDLEMLRKVVQFGINLQRMMLARSSGFAGGVARRQKKQQREREASSIAWKEHMERQRLKPLAGQDIAGLLKTGVLHVGAVLRLRPELLPQKGKAGGAKGKTPAKAKAPKDKDDDGAAPMEVDGPRPAEQAPAAEGAAAAGAGPMELMILEDGQVEMKGVRYPSVEDMLREVLQVRIPERDRNAWSSVDYLPAPGAESLGPLRDYVLARADTLEREAPVKMEALDRMFYNVMGKTLAKRKKEEELEDEDEDSDDEEEEEDEQGKLEKELTMADFDLDFERLEGEAAAAMQSQKRKRKADPKPAKGKGSASKAARPRSRAPKMDVFDFDEDNEDIEFALKPPTPRAKGKGKKKKTKGAEEPGAQSQEPPAGKAKRGLRGSPKKAAAPAAPEPAEPEDVFENPFLAFWKAVVPDELDADAAQYAVWNEANFTEFRLDDVSRGDEVGPERDDAIAPKVRKSKR